MKRICVLLFLTLSLGSFAQSDDARKKHFNLEKGIALEGYDPVSYFDNKPVEGNDKLRFTYHSVTYWFANEANLKKFQGNPQKYEPAYGGWCAFAMGETGEKVKVDPETYKILDGKLYLFYNSWGNNTLKDWNKNEMPLKLKGDQNWKRIIP